MQPKSLNEADERIGENFSDWIEKKETDVVIIKRISKQLLILTVGVYNYPNVILGAKKSIIDFIFDGEKYLESLFI